MCGIAKVQIRLAEMALYGIVGLSADRRNGGGQIGLKRLKHESRPLPTSIFQGATATGHFNNLQGFVEICAIVSFGDKRSETLQIFASNTTIAGRFGFCWLPFPLRPKPA